MVGNPENFGLCVGLHVRRGVGGVLGLVFVVVVVVWVL